MSNTTTGAEPLFEGSAASTAKKMADLFAENFSAKELAEWTAWANGVLADNTDGKKYPELASFLYAMGSQVIPALIEANSKEKRVKALESVLPEFAGKAIDATDTRKAVSQFGTLLLKSWCHCPDDLRYNDMDDLSVLVAFADLCEDYEFFKKEEKLKAA